MTAKEILEEWLSQTDQTNLKEGHYFVIQEAMKEYAKQKCQELLLLVAEKAKIEKVVVHAGEYYDENYQINKASILNVVDLEKFCS